MNLPGFYPSVCPAHPHVARRIATLGPDTASNSGRSPSRILIILRVLPDANYLRLRLHSCVQTVLKGHRLHFLVSVVESLAAAFPAVMVHLARKIQPSADNRAIPVKTRPIPDQQTRPTFSLRNNQLSKTPMTMKAELATAAMAASPPLAPRKKKK